MTSPKVAAKLVKLLKAVRATNPLMFNEIETNWIEYYKYCHENAKQIAGKDSLIF